MRNLTTKFKISEQLRNLTYQWLRDGVEVAGKTDSNYLLTNQDLGHEISIKVTASKFGHEDLVKVSATKTVN